MTLAVPGPPTAPEVRTLLARAYVADPLIAWVFPHEHERLEATAAWLGVSVERYLAAGEVEHVREDGVLAAVALWRRPWTRLAPPPGSPESLPTAGGLLRVLVGPRRAWKVTQGFHAAPQPTADVPAAYLHFLAVAPEQQGRGLGGRLLDRVVERAREDGLALRLDTTNPVNLPFYEGHGLRVTAEARLGPTGPPIWRLETDPVR